MERILVIEDDPVVYEELKKLLRANGYMPVDTLPCDLALLDINLPGKNGFELCRDLRKDHAIPVIFLTARESVEDELLAFGVGADDFIRKPYHSSVLLARMARLLHRQNKNCLSSGELILDLGELTLEFKGKRTELTKNETRIMACLMEHKMCTRQALVEDLWQNRLYIDENTLYVNINRLREKLKIIDAGDRIRTVRGIGYRLWEGDDHEL
ncbi:MAG TPA: response regulator transcription factor [Candidatus Scybalocola faecavium]|nr:response regulator transcription factor [Candidatus Scybalocola faecavium]